MHEIGPQDPISAENLVMTERALIVVELVFGGMKDPSDFSCDTWDMIIGVCVVDDLERMQRFI